MDNDFMSQLSPEQLSQLLGMGTLDERGGILQDQLAQALELRKPIDGQHTTGMGAALGGLGDVFRGVGGGMAERRLRGEQQANLAKKDAGRQTFADLLRQMGQPPQTQAAAPYQYPEPAGPQLPFSSPYRYPRPAGPDLPFGVGGLGPGGGQ